MENNNPDIIKTRCLICNNLAVSENKRHPYCSFECRAKLKLCLCNVCDNKFYSKRGNNKYCSEECKQTQCVGCNTLFTWTKSPKQKYCKASCKIRHLTRDCKFCTNSFVAGSVGVEYCSSDCSRAHKSYLRGYKVCRQCKNPISYIKDFFAPDFCSDDCRIKHTEEKHKNKIKETKNPIPADVENIVAFRVESLIRRKLEFTKNLHSGLFNDMLDSFTDTIKEAILKRDQYSCFVCEDDRRLEVHHILSRRLGGNNDEDNLVTLCMKCHRAVETGNIEHAIKKCVDRAKRNLGLLKEKNQNKMNKIDFIDALTEELDELFSNINNEESKEEVLIKVDDLIQVVEEWQTTRY